LVEETGDNHRLPTGQWFYPGPPVSSTTFFTKQTYINPVTEVLLLTASHCRYYWKYCL
jgi:hypothetical protein